MGIFGKGKKSSSEGVVDSIIGEKARFKGELISKESVSVNGEFEGKISAKAEVIIARGSKVTGNVEGGSVIVSGRVNGNIAAAQSLEITKTGRVNGDLVGGKIIIEEGSSYRGRVKVEGKAEEEAEEKEEEESIVEKEPVENASVEKEAEHVVGQIKPIKPIAKKKLSQPQMF